MSRQNIKTKPLELKVSPSLIQLLCCPIDRADLDGWDGETLSCKQGHTYPIIEGVPVFHVGGGKKGFWGIEWDRNFKSNEIDPFVAQVIAATGGWSSVVLPPFQTWFFPSDRLRCPLLAPHSTSKAVFRFGRS